MMPTATSAKRTMRRKVKNCKERDYDLSSCLQSLTVPSIHGDSFQAPQHPRKPMMVMTAPMPRRTYVPR